MFESGELWPPIRITFLLASVTTILQLLCGTPIAWWLARSKARWKEAVAAVVALPLVLPPTVLGILPAACARAERAGRMGGTPVRRAIPCVFYV